MRTWPGHSNAEKTGCYPRSMYEEAPCASYFKSKVDAESQARGGRTQVCRRLFDIYNSEPAGAYAVESDLANVKNGPAANFSTADRLARLREYRTRWRTLQWTSEITLNLEQQVVLRLHGSVLARCDLSAATTLFEFKIGRAHV